MINKKNNRPLVSIGMPVYNAEQYIKESLNSLLNQSYINFELIISDDASTDNTFSICEDFAKKDKRIRFFRQKKTNGFVNNFNFVLKKASAKYFIWAGDDDLWNKNYIKTLLSLHQKYPTISLAFSRFNNIFNDKPYNRIKNQLMRNGASRLYYLFHYLNNRNLSYFYGMHKTQIIKKIEGYQKDSRPFYGSSDFLTIFRVLLEGPAAYTDKLLFLKRDTGYYTERFITFTKLKTPPLKIIFRFLLFPLYHLYDCTYALYYSVLSSLTILDKITLFFILIFAFTKYSLIFIGEIIIGIFSFINGMFKKIINSK